MIIKAITLIQPWASLVVWGEKQIETRSWWTKYRGQLAIHAGKKIDYDACKYPRVKAVLLKHGITDPSQLPTGCILAVTQIFDCIKILPDQTAKCDVKVPGYKLSDREYSFGDYAPGRYAWVLANVRQSGRPIPAKGKQGLWDFELRMSEFVGQEWD